MAQSPKKSWLTEFREFALKGNVVDLAIGVIIGAAFGKIVDSFVKHIVMPLMSIVLPTGNGYMFWKWDIGGKTVPYGLFIGEVVNFLVIALALFLFAVKFFGWLARLHRKEAEAAPPAPPALTKDQELLMEIRDLLKRKNQ